MNTYSYSNILSPHLTKNKFPWVYWPFSGQLSAKMHIYSLDYSISSCLATYYYQAYYNQILFWLSGYFMLC